MTYVGRFTYHAVFLLSLACAPVPAQTSITEAVLHNFTGYVPRGSSPESAVTRGADGTLYGTAPAGGVSNHGLVYKVDAKGNQVVLYNFTGSADGGDPQARVTLDPAGNIYGTTLLGGASGYGTVFKLDPAGNQTVLYSFTGGADGGGPGSGVILDADGNLYGTTIRGGAHDAGVVYKLDTTSQQTVLYAFTGGADGWRPFGDLARDAAGNLYGTTAFGGSSLPRCSFYPAGCGVVYKLNPSGQETVLHMFTAGTDGAEPYAGVILDAKGNLFGTTTAGGDDACYGVCGTVFKIDTANHETVLHRFTGYPDGGDPVGPLVRDDAGNLYGTTYRNGSHGSGTVYKVDPAGQETIIYNFTGGADGGNPIGGLFLDGSGNLYGTTQVGGPAGLGAVYKLDAAGQETALNCFTAALGGSFPLSGMTRDGDGNLYGTANYGGAANAGVVYKLGPEGRATVLYTFTGAADGGNPFGTLARDPAGNLYGVTSGGGLGNVTTFGGVVYKLDATGQETVLYTFMDGDDGADPSSGLVRDAAGNLYGTTYEGGNSGCYGFPTCGLVYKVDAAGQQTVLHRFSGRDGAEPYGGVILDPEGNLYGTTLYGGLGGPSIGHGVVYKLDRAGHETVLYEFTGGDDGSNPGSGLVRDGAGNLYGTARSGVLFKVDTAGHETVLYNFGTISGAPPQGFSALAIDAAGNLYGTAMDGGNPGCYPNYSCGVVYKVDPSGQYTELYAFTGGADGANPEAPVLIDSVGNLVGTTTAGGTGAGGVVFKLMSVTAAH